MNKQRGVFGVGFVILILFICTQTSLPTALLTFLVLGIIPGTTIAIPAWAILLVYPVLIVAATYWLRGRVFFIGELAPPVKPAIAVVKKAKKTKNTRTKKTAAAKRRARAAA